MINKLQRKYIIGSVKDINNILKLINYYGLTPIKLGNGQPYKSLESWKLANNQSSISLSKYIIINLKDTKLEITTRYYSKIFKYGTPCTYIFDLNDEQIFKQSGLDCFKEFSRAYTVKPAKEYKIKRLQEYLSNESGKYVCSARPILDYNRAYEKQVLTDCYEYDLNSAYASVLLEKIPDLDNPIIADYPNLIKVNKNEVGFIIDDNLTMVKAGGQADIKFKLIETPDKLKRYLNKWYTIKKESSGNKKLEAKAMLNLPIGYCQRYNPFLRSYVVNSCNEVIKKIIDKDTLFWNTDAIFTKVRKPELKLGKEIGEFKEIPCKTLTYVGNVYQINMEDPVYRGISKSWFKAFEKKYGRKYDLLKDYNKQIDRINYYSLNWETLRVEVNNYEEIK